MAMVLVLECAVLDVLGWIDVPVEQRDLEVVCQRLVVGLVEEKEGRTCSSQVLRESLKIADPSRFPEQAC